MADPKLIQEWLQKADEDLGFAASIVEDSPFYAQICFHFQQAAEKYLKTIIAITTRCVNAKDVPLSPISFQFV